MKSQILVFIGCLVVLTSCNNFKSTRQVGQQEQIGTDSVFISQINYLQWDDETLCFTKHGSQVPVTNYINGVTVFVRFSSFACRDCLNYILDNAIKYSNNINFVFLVSDSPIQDLHVFESMCEPCKFLSVNGLKFDFDGGLTPYVFQIIEGHVINTFIPRKESPQMFTEYLDDICRNSNISIN